jgi:tetratricopeptide (TPR) repeat protein
MSGSMQFGQPRMMYDLPKPVSRNAVAARPPIVAPLMSSAGEEGNRLAPSDSAVACVSSESRKVVGEEEDLSGIIDRAQRAAQRRDWLEAWRCWEAVLARSTGHAPAYLLGGIALRETGRYGEAELVLGKGAERFPDNEQIALARAWLANAQRDWPTALSRWEQARARFPDNPWCYLGNINALRGAGRSDQVEALLVTAEAVLAAAKQRGLDQVSAFGVEFEIAKARFNWPAVRQSAEKIIACEAAPSARVFLALAQAHWHLGDRDEADRAALHAISADPRLAEAVVVRAWVATDRGDGETALSCYRTLAELNPGTARWSLKLVQLLNRFGHLEEAVNELEKLRTRWPNDPMVRTFLRNYGPAAAAPGCSASAANRAAAGDPDRADEEEIQTVADKAPGRAERVRPLVVADPERDVLLAEVTGAESAVLVFTGSNDAVSMPLPIFDRYMATLNVTAVYLKDFKRLRFLRGIRSLSEDYPGTLAALRDMLRHLGVKRVRTIGNCDGGFAAIRYGVELCADRILAFGAPTYSPQDSLTKIEQARNFMRNRLAASVASDMMDLKPFLETRQHSAQIELFYEEEDPRDRVQALHLSGLPGVRLHPQPGLSNHRLLRQLALSQEDFRGTLGNLLGVGPSATASRQNTK